MTTTYELVAVARVPQQSAAPTLSEVGPIVAPTITWTKELNRPGSIGFSCTADRLADDIKARLLDLKANPTEVWLYRNGNLVMAGPIGGYQVQGSDATVSITAPGLLSYLSYMAIHADLSYSGVDQHAIAKGLVDQWQSLDYGNFGIDTSGIVASGVTRDRAYIAAEQHIVDARLRELGQAADGFDFVVDPETRALLLYHPLQGSDLSAGVVLDGRNITDPGVTTSVAPGDVASEAYGAGDEGLTSLQSDATVRQQFGRTAVMESFDGVTVQGTLDQHTAALLDVRDQALFVPGPGLFPVADADVDDFDIGDTVTYEYDSGLGIRSGAFRVASREVSIDQDGAETMAVTFA